jgi:hypothetical protein
MGPGEFDAPHTLVFDSGRLRRRSPEQPHRFSTGRKFIAQWFHSGGRGLYIDKKTDLPRRDSESRDGRTTAADAPQTGYGYNTGIRRHQNGSARDGSVKYLIPDPVLIPTPAGRAWPKA